MSSGRVFDTEWDGDVLVLRCRGAVSSLTDIDMNSELSALCGILDERPAQGVVVDLEAATYFGSLLLELLRGLWIRLQTEGRGLALCGVDRVGEDILRLARFDTIWPIHATRAEAVADIRSRERRPSTGRV